MNDAGQRTVFKLGGSLLHQSDWPSRLRGWLNAQPPGHYLGIVGGGKMIDVLRELDQQHPLSQAAMHWRCLRVLDATYEIAAERMPDLYRINTHDELVSLRELEPRGGTMRPFWVRVGAYYAPQLLDQIPLDDQPRIGWETTSDCLALLLARLMNVKRCVLLKSCRVAHFNSLTQAVEKGVVDVESLRFQVTVESIELIQI